MDPNILGNFWVCIGVPLIIAGWRPGLRVGDSVYSGAAVWSHLSWLAYFTSLYFTLLFGVGAMELGSWALSVVRAY